MNIEIKGNLARLLATENLMVEHRQVETASFNTVNRTLTLPIWKVSENVYDLLVGHEVGHALYTPSFDKLEEIINEIPKSYLNIVEDARIEKLMKRKFPGLSRNFYSGYQELYKKNFFGTNEKDITSFLLIDRINLYFKVGLHTNTLIPFSEGEKELVKLVESAETFDDVVFAAKKILEYSKDNKNHYERDDIDELNESNEQQSSNSDSIKNNEDESSSESKNEDDSNNNSESSNQNNNNLGDKNSSLESVTDKSFSDAQKDIIDYDASEHKYIEIPKLNLDNIIMSNKDFHELLNNFWKNVPSTITSEIKSDYLDYRNKSIKEVNYLVKEFEMRKSADKYSKSTIAKTGVLNTSKIYNYKFSEDIFKKINIIPEGKNHGLIFILDWSGSMQPCLFDTVKQLFNLVWFCNKTQIPFDVYCFIDNEVDNDVLSEHQELKSNEIYVDKYFKLLNVLSSTSKLNLEYQLFNVWKLTESICQKYTYDVKKFGTPLLFSLSGTPLIQSIVALNQLIPQFKSKTNCQKLNVIILTDGDANNIYHTGDINTLIKSSKNKFMGKSLYGHSLRDKTTGRVYPKFGVTYGASRDTEIFLQQVSDKFPDVNLIGIRLLQSTNEFTRLYRNCNGWDRISSSNYNFTEKEYNSLCKIWKKNKFAEFRNCGYKILYAISIDNLSSSVDFLTASNTNLKSDFIKSQRAKTVNKKLLSSFINLIS